MQVATQNTTTNLKTNRKGENMLLSMRNVEVVYDDVILVLKGMSIDIQQGKITTLLGANGAGKTTTLKAIAGLLEAEDGKVSQGNISFANNDITHSRPKEIVKNGVFLVMEGRGIVQDMTVIENLKLGAFSRKKVDLKAEIEKVFNYFPRLKERTGLAGYLSGGEQQMLAIGRAIIANPKLILMDEPSMGLSPLLVKEVFSIIRKMNEELGVTILLVEQNANMAMKISNYGYIIEQGKIVLDGSIEDLMNNEDVKASYLGGGNERKSFKNLKSYKRRKRWL